MVNLVQDGTIDFEFDEYDDYITVEKPWIIIRNMFVGKQYIDMDCSIESKNHKTGERMEVKIYPIVKNQLP